MNMFSRVRSTLRRWFPPDVATNTAIEFLASRGPPGKAVWKALDGLKRNIQRYEDEQGTVSRSESDDRHT